MDIYKNMGGEVSKKSNSFTYKASFEPKEIISKGEKKYIIEGYVSTIDEDLSNETVTLSAQQDIYNQIKERIEKATVTGDEEHEVYIEDSEEFKDSIPKVKFIDAKLTNKGVWAKAEINKDHPNFESVWNSIKNKFLNAFSITFIPLEAVKKKINDRWKSFVNKLNLINITLTGNPMNPSATFNPVMKSTLKNINSFGEVEGYNNQIHKGGKMDKFEKAVYSKMSDSEKEEYDKLEEDKKKSFLSKMADKYELKESDYKETKSNTEESNPEVNPEKKPEANPETNTESTTETKPETKSKEKENDIDIKSITANLKADFEAKLKSEREQKDKEILDLKNNLKAEIKSLNEELEKLKNEPVKKALKSDGSKVLAKSEEFSVYNLM
jgi:hypothetical protein